MNTSHRYSRFSFTTKDRTSLQYKYTSIRRVDGSILAGVLSSFIVLCLGLRVAAYWELGLALVHLVVPSQQWLHSKPTTLEEMATETGSCSAPLTLKISIDFVPTEVT